MVSHPAGNKWSDPHLLRIVCVPWPDISRTNGCLMLLLKCEKRIQNEISVLCESGDTLVDTPSLEFLPGLPHEVIRD
jgi:hypothetical protein